MLAMSLAVMANTRVMHAIVSRMEAKVFQHCFIYR